MPLLRSNVEFAKRVFLDRLTTDQQNLGDPQNVDVGPGDTYQYANTYDPYNFGIGGDCSGWCGIGCSAALFGPNGMTWTRLFSTESFYAWANNVGGWKQTSQADCVNGSYAMKVMICHGGGGPDSHMAMWLDGWNMESNGTFGTCTIPSQVTGVASNYWNDWWVYTTPIVEDTDYRQPMGYPQGLDYAGGYISGADLAGAGIAFVCRYVNSGGSGLPDKQLLAPEFIDLCRNGIQVVFNYETDATMMLESDGVNDAKAALWSVQNLLAAAAAQGIPTAWYLQPVIYFSADFDESQNQDQTVENYLNGAKSVLGVNGFGKSCAGLYASYYLCQRAQQAGTVDYLWQTEAWSGGNIISTVNIMQRNALGFRQIDGVQADFDEAHSDDIGAFRPGPVAPQPLPPAPVPLPPPVPQPAPVSQLYTVQLGDSLDGIAFRNGVTLAALLAANPAITNPSLIYTGQVITIP
jgi:LysM domain